MDKVKQPTLPQIEAYRLCYFFDCTQQQAAKLMNCSQPNISLLLKLLKKSNPQLFVNNHVKIHFIAYHADLDSQITDKF